MLTARFPSAVVTRADIGKFTNNEGVVLASDSAIGQTTLSTEDSPGNLEVDQYLYVLGEDGPVLLQVTAVDANAKTVTVTRPVDGTTDVALDSGMRLDAAIPARALNRLAVEVIALETYMGGDGDTLTWDRNLVLQPSTTDGTYPLTLDILSGHADPEPFINFRRSTDGGTTYNSVGSIDYDPTNDELEFRNITLTAGTAADFLLEDDRSLYLGSDKDARLLYVSADDRVEYQSDKVLRFEQDDGSEALTLTPTTRLNLVGAFSIGGTDVLTSNREVAVSLTPNADNALDLGSAAARWRDIYLGPGSVKVLNAASDANAKVLLDGDGLQMGPGGATAPRVRFYEGAADRWDLLADAGLFVQGDGADVVLATKDTNTGMALRYQDSAGTNKFGIVHSPFTDQLIFHGGAAGVTNVMTLANAGTLNLVTGAFQVGGTTVFENDRNVAVSLIPNADATLGLGTSARTFSDLHVQTGTVYQGLIVNEAGGPNDFRAESQDEVNMLLVAAAQNQVNVHTNFNADWGALNVGARNASNGTEVDMVATLGDSTDSADVNGNNQKAWGVRIGNPTLNSVSGATTITDSAALYIPGPLQAGTDLTITNQYVALLEDGAGNKLFRFTAGGDYDIVSGAFQLGGTTVFESDRDFAIDLVPSTDNARAVGTAARRVSDVRGVIFDVFGAAGAANPVSRLTTDGLHFGAGGASALDVRLFRGAADRLDLAAGDSLRIQSGGLLEVLGTSSFTGDLTLKQTTADTTITWADPAGAQTLTIPDAGGNDSFVLLAAAQTLTNKTLTGATLSGTTTYTNAGAGSDPTLSSNDAAQKLTLTGTLVATAFEGDGFGLTNIVAGDSGQVQFNDGSGGFAGDSGLAWDDTNKRLTVTHGVSSGEIFKAAPSGGSGSVRINQIDSGGDLFLRITKPDGSTAFNLDTRSSADMQFNHGGGVAMGGVTSVGASVLLDLQSTDRVFRTSRVTDTQRDALTALAGMVIYNTSHNEMQFYNGTSWRKLSDEVVST